MTNLAINMSKAVLLTFLLVLTPAMISRASAGSVQKSGAKDEQRIAGKWVRPDGGYVLELSNVKADGMIRAEYFNPRPIRVSSASWRTMEDRIQIFVELRDINYPGSTYTLLYDARQDRLLGYYYQAALGQTFDVLFLRKK